MTHSLSVCDRRSDAAVHSELTFATIRRAAVSVQTDRKLGFIAFIATPVSHHHMASMDTFLAYEWPLMVCLGLHRDDVALFVDACQRAGHSPNDLLQDAFVLSIDANGVSNVHHISSCTYGGEWAMHCHAYNVGATLQSLRQSLA